jgi:uncharacterized protein YoxC
MSTANNVELLIITIVLCILFIVLIAFVIEVMTVVGKIRKLVVRTEEVMNNVESAAENLKHMTSAVHSRFPLISLISELFNSKQNK